jgi:RNA polymerase sigma-70 factor, ECF subfamily
VDKRPDLVDDAELARACAAGDAEAIARFESLYFTGLPPALARMGLGRDAIDEVVQILRERFFVARPDAPPRVLELVGKGDLAALVRIAGVRIALNLRRRDQRIDPSEEDAIFDAIAPDADPEVAVLQAEQRAALKRAVEDAVRGLEPRERGVLRLHLIHGLSIDEIGRVYHVHRATAARWLDRIRDRLERESRRLLEERTGLAGRDLESAVRLVQSRLEVSFRRVLQTLATR